MVNQDIDSGNECYAPEVFEEPRVTEKNRGGGTPSFGNPQSDNTVDPNTIDMYRLLNDTYYGTGVVSSRSDTESVLIRSRSELLFAERLMRSMYTGFVAPFVDAQYKPVFEEQAPQLKVNIGQSEYTERSQHHFLEWAQNVDNGGTDLVQYVQNNMHGSYLYGVSYAVMDKPSEPNAAPVAYVQAADTVDPYSIETDRYGKLTQIGFYECVKSGRGHKLKRTLWVYDGERREVVEQEAVGRSLKKAKWKDVSTAPITIGYMPVYPMFSVPRMDKTDYLPIPTRVYSLAKLNVGHYNVASEYGWHINRQALAYLYTTADIEAVRDGNTSAIKLENAGDVTPSIAFLSADTGIAPNHKDYEQTIVQKIIDLMAEGGVVMTRGDMVVPESGVARAYRYRAQNVRLGQSVNMATELIRWIAETYKQYQGAENFEVEAKFKTDYSINESLTVLDLAEVVRTMREAGAEDGYRESLIAMIERVTGKNAESLARVREGINEVRIVGDFE